MADKTYLYINIKIVFNCITANCKTGATNAKSRQQIAVKPCTQLIMIYNSNGVGHRPGIRVSVYLNLNFIECAWQLFMPTPGHWAWPG
jgi:hypothetical protein